MKVKHRLTEQEKEISYIDWRNERRQHDYDIIDSGDLVYLYETLPEECVKYLLPYDRQKVDNMVTHQPGVDGYVELSQVPLLLRLRMVIEELRRQSDYHGFLEEIMLRVGLSADIENKDKYINEINQLNLATIALSKEGAWLKMNPNNSLQFLKRDDQLVGHVL